MMHHARQALTAFKPATGISVLERSTEKPFTIEIIEMIVPKQTPLVIEMIISLTPKN
jgi:hypothetical protein